MTSIQTCAHTLLPNKINSNVRALQLCLFILSLKNFWRRIHPFIHVATGRIAVEWIFLEKGRYTEETKEQNNNNMNCENQSIRNC